MTQFTHEDLENTFVAFLDEHKIKLKKVAQPIRVALTGKAVSPGIFEVMEVLGKEEVLERIAKALSHIKSKLDKLSWLLSFTCCWSVPLFSTFLPRPEGIPPSPLSH